uniref:Uncharacterized protein n=1 Tax=Kalanchoe fedtschenkoi TaxID=63787 RepID=A0A7N0SX30_KALFE
MMISSLSILFSGLKCLHCKFISCCALTVSCLNLPFTSTYLKQESMPYVYTHFKYHSYLL